MIEQNLSPMEIPDQSPGGRRAWVCLATAGFPQPSGLVDFSRVGFCANENEALVLMGFRCGDLCGAGRLYILAMGEASWKIEETRMGRMSWAACGAQGSRYQSQR